MQDLGLLRDPRATFAGIQSCTDLSAISLKDVDVAILGVPLEDKDATRPGARLGPLAIRTNGYYPQHGSRPSLPLRTDGLLDLTVRDFGDIPTDGEVVEAHAILKQAAKSIALAATIPVFLGGDHTITPLCMLGLSAAQSLRDVTLLHFSAHPIHAEQLQRAPEGGIVGLFDGEVIRADQVFQFGTRGYARVNTRPDAISHMCNMNYIMRHGLDMSLSRVLAEVSAESRLYLSVNLNVADPCAAPGVGSLEPGGLTAREILDAVRRLTLERSVVALEILNLAVPYDKSEITASLANRIVLEMLCATARRRSDQGSGTLWSPLQPLLADRGKSADKVQSSSLNRE